jgi:hypothetical protein
MPDPNLNTAKTMKKIFIFLLCAVLTFSCALGDFALNSAPTPTAAFTSTLTRTPMPTATPVTPSVTFTLTPTLVGLKSATPAQQITSAPVLSITPLALITPNTATPTLQMKGFLSVSISDKEFFKGELCQPTSIKFIAQVNNPSVSAIVDLYVRFNTKTAGVNGEWTRITMKSIGAGTHTYDLVPADIKGNLVFRNAWVQYQFVASTSKGREIGRTAIFKEALTLSDCNPTPTTSPSPTPTVLKP